MKQRGPRREIVIVHFQLQGSHFLSFLQHLRIPEATEATAKDVLPFWSLKAFRSTERKADLVLLSKILSKTMVGRSLETSKSMVVAIRIPSASAIVALSRDLSTSNNFETNVSAICSMHQMLSIHLTL